jgi:hypothetical protein
MKRTLEDWQGRGLARACTLALFLPLLLAPGRGWAQEPGGMGQQGMQCPMMGQAGMLMMGLAVLLLVGLGALLGALAAHAVHRRRSRRPASP